VMKDKSLDTPFDIYGGVGLRRADRTEHSATELRTGLFGVLKLEGLGGVCCSARRSPRGRGNILGLRPLEIWWSLRFWK
jgi:hypothetical protein